jgi:DNA-binding transcriptional ArsR family regulator
MVSLYLPIVKAYELVLGALADATRRKIFEDLRKGPRAVGELAAGLPVSRPAVSQHLKVLREAGLVREQHQGTRNYYSIDLRGLNPLRAYLEEFWGEVLAAFEAAANEKNGGRHEQ